MVWSADAYLSAVNFAARAHRGQRVPGSEDPYLRHVVTVAAEVMAALARREDVARPDLAVVCALLHDTIEDTATTAGELADRFGPQVAAGVAALSKDPSLQTKAARMDDSLRRIREQPPEVWMVKLADRITNLQAPPSHWPPEKVAAYRVEAQGILERLGPACSVLSARLAAKIAAYPPVASAGGEPDDA